MELSMVPQLSGPRTATKEPLRAHAVCRCAELVYKFCPVINARPPPAQQVWAAINVSARWLANPIDHIGLPPHSLRVILINDKWFERESLAKLREHWHFVVWFKLNSKEDLSQNGTASLVVTADICCRFRTPKGFPVLHQRSCSCLFCPKIFCKAQLDFNVTCCALYFRTGELNFIKPYSDTSTIHFFFH